MRTLITGATKGIGRALAHEFASHEHDLLLVARDEKRLQQVTQEIGAKYSVKVDYHVADLSQPGSALTLYQALQDQGIWIKSLVNNAGIGYLGPYADMDLNKLHDLVQLNMISCGELTRLYLNEFIARNEGSILQVASTAAFVPGPLMAAYYASKAYLVSLSRAIAYEIKETNVSLSILCPGATNTHFFAEAGLEHSLLEKGYSGMMDPAKVATIAYKGLQKKKLMIIPGFRNKIMAYSGTLAPKCISAAIANYLHGKA